MLTVPVTLDAWTSDVVKELLDAHCHEDERFEWKGQLPPDPSGQARLVDCVASMANGDGGFIIFGVKDERQLPPLERIVGLDPTLDFPKLFSDKIEKRIDPAPAYKLRADAVPIAGTANVLRVVQVLTGLGPHSVAGRFMKRVAGSAREMTTTEVRRAVLDVEEMRAKLRLLMLELISARNAAREIEAFAKSKTFFPIRRIDTTTIARLHAETLPLLGSLPQVSQNLSLVCGEAEALNYQLDCVAPLIGQAVGQSFNATYAADILTRGTRSRSAVDKVANTVVHLLAKHFGEAAILEILAMQP